MKKAKYKSPLWSGDKYGMYEVEGEVIDRAIPPFRKGEICIQRTVASLDPLRYKKRSFQVVHIATGTKVGPYTYPTREAAIADLKRFLKDKKKTRQDLDKAVKEVEYKFRKSA